MDRNEHRFYTVFWILQQGWRWLLLGLLILAPWAFGATRPWAITWVVAGMYACAAMALGSVVAQTFASRCASPGQIPWVSAILTVMIVFTGWSAAWNAHSYFDTYLLRFIAEARWMHFWPSTVDSQASNATMERLSALVLTMLVSAHAAQSPMWRRRILVTVAFTGLSIALFGMAQKLAQAPLLFWNDGNYGETVFATYRYHANAGAYLNVVWPICGALAMDSFARRAATVQRAMWLPAMFIVIAGVALNISKGAHLVAALLGAGAAVVALISCFRVGGTLPLSKVIGWAIVTTAIVGTVIVIGFQPVVSRWTEYFTRDFGSEGRIWMARACMDMIRERPFFGFGPGTFILVFPFYSEPYGDSLAGVWRYAHCDYLQMLVEWGAFGCLLWAGLIGGGLIKALRRVCCQVGESNGSPNVGSGFQYVEAPREDKGLTERQRGSRLMDLGVLFSLGGLLIHATFDFPLQIASIQLYFATLLGIAWRQSAKRTKRRGKDDRK